MRHFSREYALQVLYQYEMLQISVPEEENSIETKMEELLNEINTKQKIADFCRELVLGVSKNQEKIDEIITSNMTEWRLDRISIVTRNLLRLATYEMCIVSEIDYQIVMNEALDIAKDFIDDETRNFLNSVLQKIYNSHCKKS